MSAARAASALKRNRPLVLTLFAGLLLGFAVSRLFANPAPILAEAVDRTDKFVIFTAPQATGSVGESVFVLDTVNGKLYGGTVGGGGKFVASFGRDIAQDFGQRQANADYAVVAGRTEGGNGVVYVAENRSGTVVAYGIPTRRGQAMPLIPVDSFQFRQAIQ